jgi:succinylglutamate desuccinylase
MPRIILTMNVSAHNLSCFASGYTEARTTWLNEVVTNGGRVSGIKHTESGPNGEALWLDIAQFGDPQAKSVFVVSCGTHGIEGYAGSAVQSAWLKTSGLGELPSGTAVLLVHAINPWGFAHWQRVTENNVDLNRNFISFDGLPERNLGYSELHPHLILENWNENEIARAFNAMDEFRNLVGEQAFSDAFNGGQYHELDGLFYGGQKSEWSNHALNQLLPVALKNARDCMWVDLHTGIGPYGLPFFFNFDKPDSASRKRALHVWGEEAFSGRGSTHKAVATYQGLMIDALAYMLPQCDLTAVVIEFGTHERRRMQRAHLALAWMRRQNSDSEAYRHAQAEYRDAFIPSDPLWRESVLREGVKLCQRGCNALVTDHG